MIVDSSALVSVLTEENDAEAIDRAVSSADSRLISAVTYVETSIVLTPSRHDALDRYLAGVEISIVPFDQDQARVAREAYARYGKGSGSRARLNFGDCMAYALAKVTDEPLLFKGDNFGHTDVTPAR